MRRSIRMAVGLLLCVSGVSLVGCQSPGANASQNVALVYLDAGRYQDAAREAEQAIRRQPDDPKLRLIAARAHAGLGNTQRAIEHLEVALDLSPSDPEVSLLLGELEQSQENLPDAYVAFRRATTLAPDEFRRDVRRCRSRRR